MAAEPGQEVAWIARRAPGLGDARITIDGTPLASAVRLGAVSTAYRQVVFRKVFAHTRTHRITIRPSGNGPIELDGFLALR